jgi:hypothetical protein
MKLIPVPAHFIDQAWFKEGASCLSKACETSGGEITGDQLKLMLSRGERILLKMEDEKTVGWASIRIDQLPNFRVYHVCELTAEPDQFHRFMDAAKVMAQSMGCSRIRCSAKPAQARLYRMKCGFTPVYETQEVIL